MRKWREKTATKINFVLKSLVEAGYGMSLISIIGSEPLGGDLVDVQFVELPPGIRAAPFGRNSTNCTSTGSPSKAMTTTEASFWLKAYSP